MEKILVLLEIKQCDLLMFKAAKERGLKVIIASVLEDPFDDIPNELKKHKSDVDSIVRLEASDDAKTVVEKCKQSINGDVVGVYTSWDARITNMAEIRIFLNLPTTSPEVLSLVINKSELRQKLVKNNFSKTKCLLGDEVLSLEEWCFPNRSAFLKRSFGAGGMGVRRVSSIEELKVAIQDLSYIKSDDPDNDMPNKFLDLQLEKGGELMLEEEAPGVLLSYEGFYHQGRLHTIGLTEPLLLEYPTPDLEPTLMPGCIHPVYPNHWEKTLKSLEMILGTLGVTDSVLHIELVLDENGEFEIIDLNPRFAGANLLWVFNIAWGTKVENVLIDWALGEFNPQVLPTKPQKVARLQYFLGPEGGTSLDSLSVSNEEHFDWFIQFQENGKLLPEIPSEADWLGGYIVSAENEKSVTEYSLKMRKSILVNNEHECVY